MRFANIRDLRVHSNHLLAGLAREDVVVTKRGKPVAAIVYLDEDLLDAFVISRHPDLLRGIRRELERWKAGKLETRTLEEVRARLLGGDQRRSLAKPGRRS